MTNSPAFIGAFAALACAWCWGVAIILFKKCGETFSPFALNLFKNVVAIILFVATILILPNQIPFNWLSMATVALLVNGVMSIGVADTLVFKSLNIIGASRSALVALTYTPFMIVSSYFYLGERLTLLQAMGGAAIILAVLLTLRSDHDSAATTGNLTKGILYGVLGEGLMAVPIVMVKPLLETLPISWCALVRLAGGTITLLFLSLFSKQYRADIKTTFRPNATWILAIAASVLGTYLAVYAWLTGFKYIDASIAALLTQTSTIWIVLMAVFILKERLTLRTTLAIGIALAGAILVLV